MGGLAGRRAGYYWTSLEIMYSSCHVQHSAPRASGCEVLGASLVHFSVYLLADHTSHND
jgi:hypothetical protein